MIIRASLQSRCDSLSGPKRSLFMKSNAKTSSLILGLAMIVSGFSRAGISVAAEPESKPVGPYYGVFRELPVTDIKPQGWLAQFWERQRDGLALHREASGFPFDAGDIEQLKLIPGGTTMLPVSVFPAVSDTKTTSTNPK
jgi:hypothetical protein